MKIYTPEGTELMTIDRVETTPAGIVIAGTIMGAMPMTGVIRASELKAGRKFLSVRLVRTALAMMFRRG